MKFVEIEIEDWFKTVERMLRRNGEKIVEEGNEECGERKGKTVEQARVEC